jgi:predicted O-methyltransferase YrrM
MISTNQALRIESDDSLTRKVENKHATLVQRTAKLQAAALEAASMAAELMELLAELDSKTKSLLRRPTPEHSTEYFELQSVFRASAVNLYASDLHRSEDVLAHALDGSLKLFDALYLRELLGALQPASILEVGSYLGFSTRWVLESSRDWAPDLTSVDPGVRHRIFDDPRRHFEQFTKPHAGRIKQIDAYFSRRNEGALLHDYFVHRPTLGREDALGIVRSLPTLTAPFGTFDFVMLDGDHSYRSVLESIALAASMMPAGGCIVIGGAAHWPDVLTAIRALEVARNNPQLLATPMVSLVAYPGEHLRQWSSSYHHRGIDASLLSDGLAVIRVTPAAIHTKTNPSTSFEASTR